jgi:hypothetical protein
MKTFKYILENPCKINNDEKLHVYLQKMKLDYCLVPYTKIKFKVIQNLNVKLRSIKNLEKKIGQIFMMLNLAITSFFFSFWWN